MDTIPCMVIAVFVFFMACQLCTELMASTRFIGQALFSVVYVTVPNSTVARQIARYSFCHLKNNGFLKESTAHQSNEI